MVDREAVRTHYARMGDEQFAHFATHEAGTLEPEAVEILRQEMVHRGSWPDPGLVIDVQRRRLSSEEFERIVVRFRQEPCPICGQSGTLLNGARVSRGGRPELEAGCRSCLIQLLREANAGALAVGLLGRPRRAAVDSTRNDDAIRELTSDAQTPALREYVWAHRGAWAHFMR